MECEACGVILRSCRAMRWLQLSPTGSGQHATKCYVFGFSTQGSRGLVVQRKLLFKFKLCLVLCWLSWAATLHFWLSWVATLDLTITRIRSYLGAIQVASPRMNRLFDPPSGDLTPAGQ